MDKKSGDFGLDDLARQLAQSLPRNLRVLGEDLERNFKALLKSGLERMDLVTREEFDVQSAVLERTREKLETIDLRLAELERGPGEAPAATVTRSEKVAGKGDAGNSRSSPETPSS